MITVGITGGIGSGKSTFCSFWEEEGVPVIYADVLARQIMTEDPDLADKIRSVFGEEAYLGDGSLNRQFLATEAFAKDRVGELNAIVHPVLREKIVSLAKQHEERGDWIFAYEAAILLNEGRPAHLDYVILLQAEQNSRIRRTAERDEASEQSISERMSKQPDFDSLTSLCDFLVTNNSSLTSLKVKAREILDHLRTLHT